MTRRYNVSYLYHALSAFFDRDTVSACCCNALSIMSHSRLPHAAPLLPSWMLACHAAEQLPSCLSL